MTDKVALAGILAVSDPYVEAYTCQKKKIKVGSLHHFSN